MSGTIIHNRKTLNINVAYFHDRLTRVFGEHVIVVGGLGPIGLAAVGAGDPVGEGVRPHVPLQQRAQREPAPTQLTLKQTRYIFQC